METCFQKYLPFSIKIHIYSIDDITWIIFTSVCGRLHYSIKINSIKERVLNKNSLIKFYVAQNI